MTDEEVIGAVLHEVMPRALAAAMAEQRDLGADWNIADIVAAAIRAAAPGLIAAGREQAAKAIEAAGQHHGCDYVHMDWAAEEYARIARGGTP